MRFQEHCPQRRQLPLHPALGHRAAPQPGAGSPLPPHGGRGQRARPLELQPQGLCPPHLRGPEEGPAGGAGHQGGPPVQAPEQADDHLPRQDLPPLPEGAQVLRVAHIGSQRYEAALNKGSLKDNACSQIAVMCNRLQGTVIFWACECEIQEDTEVVKHAGSEDERLTGI